MTIDTWAQKQIEARLVEARIVKKIFKTLRDADDPIVSADDTEDRYTVTTLDEVLNAAFSVDQIFFHTRRGGWVCLVMGEGWDILCDYSVSLEEALYPVTEYVDKNLV